MAGGLNDDDLEEVHEINVVPLIDVMLVLLIIFMIAAPLATVDIPVDLPESTVTAQPHPDKPLLLSIKADLSLVVGKQTLPREELATVLDRETGGNREQRVFLRADRSVVYGDLSEVMNALRDAGYTKVALVGLELRRKN
jgi:biopolymer transport protein ExbD